jgi:hypothetical protein
MSTATLLGMMMASLPDSALLKIEGRGTGTVAVIECGDETYRVQLDALDSRATDRMVA